jgi:hypothetical protein
MTRQSSSIRLSPNAGFGLGIGGLERQGYHNSPLEVMAYDQRGPVQFQRGTLRYGGSGKPTTESVPMTSQEREGFLEAVS